MNVGVNDSWIMQIILGLLDEALALTELKTAMSTFPHISPTLALASVTRLCHSPCLPIFTPPKHRLITTVPVSSAVYNMVYIHGSANGTFHIQVSPFVLKPLCFLLILRHVLKVSVMLERISASYQHDSPMPTSLLCPPAANYHVDQRSFLSGFILYEKQTILCEAKAELKHNSNEEARKGHTGIKNRHTLLIF